MRNVKSYQCLIMACRAQAHIQSAEFNGSAERSEQSRHSVMGVDFCNMQHLQARVGFLQALPGYAQLAWAVLKKTAH